MSTVPVITIDGPTASGKGTVTQKVAEYLGWHVLDSGALYRLTALAAQQQAVNLDDPNAVANVASALDVRFDAQGVWLSGREVNNQLRREEVGLNASQLAAYPLVRDALLQRQRDFCQPPGLVADGRDMGTVVFPNATLKIFLIADVQERARRRHKQLIDKGVVVKMESVIEDLQARDDRDQNRTVAPLQPASDAHIIDSSYLSIDETVAQVLACWSNIKT
ncbi:MAG TPA: (d)CMP kinase [Paenalcaligenes sp.]|nr:(d)CMP kinase [Paenalcaligenes sp.]